MTAAVASDSRDRGIRAGGTERESTVKEKSTTVMIARNKHWRNIAAYHGSWLQLPSEMLEYLCLLNITAMPYSSDVHDADESAPRADGHINMDSNRSGRNIHRPAIDPIVLADLLHTRGLVDEASELVVSAMQIPLHTHGNGSGSGGSSIGMHTRRKLLRRAVEKMAAAYRIDEIAASVNAMQAASGLDELVDRLVSMSPDDAHTNDVIYTRFFHEKIPSRQLAGCTSLAPLDELIRRNPDTPEYYRTRGTVLCVKGQHSAAVKDLSTAMQLARQQAIQKRRRIQPSTSSEGGGRQVPIEDGENQDDFALRGPEIESLTNSSLAMISEDLRRNPLRAGRGTERQALFQRGGCYLQWAFHIMHTEIYETEKLLDEQQRLANSKQENGDDTGVAGVTGARKRRQRRKKVSKDQARKEARGYYVGQPLMDEDMAWYAEPHNTPISPLNGSLREACRDRLVQQQARVTSLIRRAIRDYMRFLRWFPHALPSIETILEELEQEAKRLGSQNTSFTSGTVVKTANECEEETATSSQPTTKRDPSTLLSLLSKPPKLKVAAFSTAVYRSYFVDTNPIQIPRQTALKIVLADMDKETAPDDTDSTTEYNTIIDCLKNQCNVKSTSKDRTRASDLPNLMEDEDLEAIEMLWDDGFPHITYHPLLIEAHYSIAMGMLLLGDWPRAVAWHVRASIRGFPIFMPARSVARSDFCEITERVGAFITNVDKPTGADGTTTVEEHSQDPTTQLYNCTRFADHMRVAARWLQRRNIEASVSYARQRAIIDDINAKLLSINEPRVSSMAFPTSMNLGYSSLAAASNPTSEPFAVPKLGGVPLYSCRVRVALAWLQTIEY
ncbi:hypothetical protein BDF22DRAFT_663526 [Syncephalis plumigaleata]|nr:hypothetical protein BDF22DRAFT_663526 [Syncephalis plumigaleata]